MSAACELLTLNFSQIISPEAQQIITALLIKVKNSCLLFSNAFHKEWPPDLWAIPKQEPKDRLGTVAEGQDDGSKDDEKSLKSHNFFKGVDWKGLEEVNGRNNCATSEDDKWWSLQGTVAAPFKPAVASETCNFDKEFTAQPPVLDKIKIIHIFIHFSWFRCWTRWANSSQKLRSNAGIISKASAFVQMSIRNQLDSGSLVS